MTLLMFAVCRITDKTQSPRLPKHQLQFSIPILYALLDKSIDASKASKAVKHKIFTNIDRKKIKAWKPITTCGAYLVRFYPLTWSSQAGTKYHKTYRRV